MGIDGRSQRTFPKPWTGLTALGSSQTTAFLLDNGVYHEFTTVSSGQGCVLPVPVELPREITISNNGGSALLVYPQIGGTINNGSVNASVSVAAGSSVTYWPTSFANWQSRVTGGSGGGGTVAARASIYLDSSQTIPVTTHTLVTFNATLLDNAGMANPESNSITVPRTGHYSVNLTLFAGSAGNQAFITLLVNSAGAYVAGGAAQSAVAPLFLHQIVALNAGDVLQGDIFIVSGGVLSGGAPGNVFSFLEVLEIPS